MESTTGATNDGSVVEDRKVDPFPNFGPPMAGSNMAGNNSAQNFAHSDNAFDNSTPYNSAPVNDVPDDEAPHSQALVDQHIVDRDTSDLYIGVNAQDEMGVSELFMAVDKSDAHNKPDGADAGAITVCGKLSLLSPQPIFCRTHILTSLERIFRITKLPKPRLVKAPLFHPEPKLPKRCTDSCSSLQRSV